MRTPVVYLLGAYVCTWAMCIFRIRSVETQDVNQLVSKHAAPSPSRTAAPHTVKKKKKTLLPHAPRGVVSAGRPSPFRQPRALLLARRLCCSRWVRRTGHGRLPPSLLGVAPPVSLRTAPLLGLVHAIPFRRRREVPSLAGGVVRARAGASHPLRSPLVVRREASRRWAQVARLERVDESGGCLG